MSGKKPKDKNLDGGGKKPKDKNLDGKKPKDKNLDGKNPINNDPVDKKPKNKDLDDKKSKDKDLDGGTKPKDKNLDGGGKNPINNDPVDKKPKNKDGKKPKKKFKSVKERKRRVQTKKLAPFNVLTTNRHKKEISANEYKVPENTDLPTLLEKIRTTMSNSDYTYRFKWSIRGEAILIKYVQPDGPYDFKSGRKNLRKICFLSLSGTTLTVTNYSGPSGIRWSNSELLELRNVVRN